MTFSKRREKTRPVSVRLTETEIARLQIEAGSINLSLHIRERLIGGDLQKRRRTRMPKAGEVELSAILARLGQLELGASLRKLAYAAEIGALPLDEETAGAIRSASDSLRLLRADLLRAIGLKEGTPE